MNIGTIFAASIAAITLVACAAPAAQTSPAGRSVIAVKDAWARPTLEMQAQGEAKPTGASGTNHGDMKMNGVNGAAYMVIENTGNAPDRLLSVSGDVAEMIQVHQTKEKDGVMTMEEMKDGVEVPANGSLTLKPASYHIMMMNMKKALKPGDVFRLTLKFQSGQEIPVDVAVREF
jgi:copper(I)-binding protein